MAPTFGNATATAQGNSEDPNLHCSPATAWSIFIFFFSNYFAHCGTVKTLPGASASDIIVASVMALCVPCSGVIRAIDSLLCHSRFRKNRNPLEQAARAGALRMVVRNSLWRPQQGDVFDNFIPNTRTYPNQNLGTVAQTKILPATKKRPSMMISVSAGPPSGKSKESSDFQLDIDKTSPSNPSDSAIEVAKQNVDYSSLPRHHVGAFGWIHEENQDVEESEFMASLSFTFHSERAIPNLHGAASLPFGYSWACVPPSAVVVFAEPRAQNPDQPAPRPSITSPPKLCSNYNWMQSVIAIFQASSAAFTLYRSRGGQIQRYGYAAFSFTVVPYLVMSILNFLSQIATADYPTLYMVGSPEMEEARRHGGAFDGVVGSLVSADGPEARMPAYRVKNVVQKAGMLLTLERIDQGEKLSDSSDIDSVVIRVGKKQEGSSFIMVHKVRRFQRYDEPKRGTCTGYFYLLLLPLLLSSISIIVVGLFSHFKNGNSTHSQRAWITSWYVVGIISGVVADWLGGLLNPLYEEQKGETDRCVTITSIIFLVFISMGLMVPTIGGFIVVGKMLREYGICEFS